MRTFNSFRLPTLFIGLGKIGEDLLYSTYHHLTRGRHWTSDRWAYFCSIGLSSYAEHDNNGEWIDLQINLDTVSVEHLLKEIRRCLSL